jgi:hypothetical protein
MLYLLDANVLIDAHRGYLSIDRVHQFWDWLVDVGEQGLVKIPLEMYEEIRYGNTRAESEAGKIDLLAKWAKEDNVNNALMLNEEVNEALVARITCEGYAENLTDTEIEEIGRDPFLIAYALVDPANRCIVTTEASKPSKQRSKRRLPDVCIDFNVKSCHAVTFIHDLDFKTDWNHDR